MPLESDANGAESRSATPVPRHTLAHSPQMGGHCAVAQPPHCSTSIESPCLTLSSDATRRAPSSDALPNANDGPAPPKSCLLPLWVRPAGYSGYLTRASGLVHEGAGPSLAPCDEKRLPAACSGSGARSRATGDAWRSNEASEK